MIKALNKLWKQYLTQTIGLSYWIQLTNPALTMTEDHSKHIHLLVIFSHDVNNLTQPCEI